jgi:hypothetical protein
MLQGDHGCVACGREPGSVHHVVRKGAPHHGDDVPENCVLLCGSGSSGCHGAVHGSPYEVAGVRRERSWVVSRIGAHLVRYRLDVLAYVARKLGPGADEFLAREYAVTCTP